MIRLVVVDDHPVVRDGLIGMFATQADLEVVGEAASGEEALTVAAATAPDVVLTDLRMPGLGGAALIRRLRERVPAARVVVLTTYDTDDDVLPAIEAGSCGYLLKDAPRAELYRAVRAAARGEPVLSPSVAAKLMRRVRTPPPAPERPVLSAREREVLRLIAAGKTNRAAAAALAISEATVKTHLLHIYAKLGVADRAAAVAAGYEQGLL